MEIVYKPIDWFREYARNPRKNDDAVDRMCGSIREFGLKIPCLVRGDGEVVDGHLRLKAARKLGIAEIPVILCDEWTPAQVKAFRLMVNRSVTWAEWDSDLLGLELLDLKNLDFDLGLTGFDDQPRERRREWNAADKKSQPSKRRFSPGTRICRDYAWRSQTGMPSCGFWKRSRDKKSRRG